MAYTPKDMSGRIFDNSADRTNDKQPNWTGTVNIRGEILRVAGWYQPPDESHRTASIGLSLENKDEYDRQRKAQNQESPQQRIDDGDPF